MEEGLSFVPMERLKLDIVRYSWGLDKATNNQEKALDLLQSIRLLKNHGTVHTRIIGDLQTIINLLVKNRVPRDIMLRQIVLRIQRVASSFQSLLFFNVLRNNNKEADQEANRVVALDPDACSLNANDLVWVPLP